MKRVLALDPGERVGWATSHMTPDRLTVDDHGILRMKDLMLALETPYHQLAATNFDIVIFETWILTRQGAQDSIGSEMESSQVIGAIRTAAWRTNGRTQLVRSLPKRKTDAEMYLRNDRPDYAAICEIIDAAPARHDDSHYVDALLHTVAYFHKEFI